MPDLVAPARAVTSPAMPYRIELTPEADEHLGRLTARERATLFDHMERQLIHQPTLATRARKRMEPGKPGFITPWELRVQHLRVYYEVRELPSPVVTVRAIGAKHRNRVRIGDEWWELKETTR